MGQCMSDEANEEPVNTDPNERPSMSKKKSNSNQVAPEENIAAQDNFDARSSQSDDIAEGTEDEISESSTDDTEEWRNNGIKKKIVKASGKTHNTKEKESCDEFKESEEVKSRRERYKFGSTYVNVVNPSNLPQPNEDEVAEVAGELELEYAHGFNGRNTSCRQNLYLSDDGSKLIYFIATIGVVFDYKENKQSFFQKHNDDVTCICIAPKSMEQTWAASGQKDPKDLHSKKGGKDLPKVWIWDYLTMEPVQLIDNICKHSVLKIQWSAKSNLLYVLCGNEAHTLKVYDPSHFGVDGDAEAEIKPIFSKDTVKEEIYGFEINGFSDKEGIVDEIIMFGKNTAKWIEVIGGDDGVPIDTESKTLKIREFRENGEKSFGCAVFMDAKHYCIGGHSGVIYVCVADKAVNILELHDVGVGDLCWNGEQLISVGYDDKIIHWKWNEQHLKKTQKIQYKSNSLQPRAMVVNGDNGQIFIGNRNNQILAINAGEKEIDIVLDCHDGEVWALCAHPNDANIYATGSYDQRIKIWNAEQRKCIFTKKLPMIKGKKARRRSKKQKNFIHCGAWSADGNLLAFGTRDSNIYIFQWIADDQSIKLVEVIHIPRRNRHAQTEPVSHLRFSPDSALLAATHYNGQLYVFDVVIEEDEYDLCQWKATMEHIAAPIQLQFGKNEEGNEVIKTFTRDYEIVHWAVDRNEKDCKFCPYIPDPDVVKFEGDPLIAGWDVKGCYVDGFDGTDLNDIAVTKDKTLCISGDDYGAMRVYSYPVIKQEPFKQYNNHGEFVVAVKLLANDEHVISCGGADRAVLQWKLNN